MNQTLVNAAVIVLSDAPQSAIPAVHPSQHLATRVSSFLRSLHHFPDQPLPFALETYRRFFVLVAEWRNDDPCIDARHTIDRTRTSLELTSALQRYTLDQHLVACPEFWGGPCDLTFRLLSLLISLHDGTACADDVTNVAQLLVGSLERAANTVAEPSERHLILGLLGILLDALAELDCTAATTVDGVSFDSSTARLLVHMVWRRNDEVKVAVGILERIKARRTHNCFDTAVQIASAVVANITDELHSISVIEPTISDNPIRNIQTIFECCLDTMLAIDASRAIQVIDVTLLAPLSCLLSTILEQSVDDSSNPLLAELDATATWLYDLCYESIHGSCT